MKIKFSLAASLVVLVTFYIAYGGYRQRAARNETYQSVLNQYKKDLYPGMSRDTVHGYLNRQHTQFDAPLLPGGGNARSYRVNIGMEPTGKASRKEEVYIALDFDGPPKEEGRNSAPRANIPSGGPDVLKDIRIYRHEW